MAGNQDPVGSMALFKGLRSNRMIAAPPNPIATSNTQNEAGAI
jgi:hypothetical protein